MLLTRHCLKIRPIFLCLIISYKQYCVVCVFLSCMCLILFHSQKGPFSSCPMQEFSCALKLTRILNRTSRRVQLGSLLLIHLVEKWGLAETAGTELLALNLPGGFTLAVYCLARGELHHRASQGCYGNKVRHLTIPR